MKKNFSTKVAKWFDEANIMVKSTLWWSQHGSKLTSGLLEAIIELGGSFSLRLRLGVCECGFGSKPSCMIFTWEELKRFIMIKRD